MKKGFSFYIIVWAILVALYNIIVFCVPADEYETHFWIAWGLVMATFVGQLCCAGVALNAKNQNKVFMSIPMVTSSYAALIFSTIICSILMAIPEFPVWLTVIICAATFGFCAIGVLKATAAAQLVGAVETKVKMQTFFVRSMTADAASLDARAQGDAIKAYTKKVYEAIRYSDPMSHSALSGVEGDIVAKFAQLRSAVDAADLDLVTQYAEQVLYLIAERNNKCKVLK